MARVDVDIDIDDLMWSMNKWEKEEMAEALYDDGVIPIALQNVEAEISNREPSTNLEQELSSLLDAVWSNRLFINHEDFSTLRELSKKGI